MARGMVSVFVLSALMLVTISTVVSAQVSWSGGIKAGINLAKVNGSDATGFDEFRTGFVGGGFLTAHVSEGFGVQFEGLYSQKGGKASESSAEATLKLDYIEIPVLAMGRFPAGKKAILNIYGGPTFGFLLK
jgi:hypothetical protein